VNCCGKAVSSRTLDDDSAPPLTSELSCYHHLEGIDALDYLFATATTRAATRAISRAHIPICSIIAMKRNARWPRCSTR
jgi:hypothetical protein